MSSVESECGSVVGGRLRIGREGQGVAGAVSRGGLTLVAACYSRAG